MRKGGRPVLIGYLERVFEAAGRTARHRHDVDRGERLEAANGELRPPCHRPRRCTPAQGHCGAHRAAAGTGRITPVPPRWRC